MNAPAQTFAERLDDIENMARHGEARHKDALWLVAELRRRSAPHRVELPQRRQQKVRKLKARIHAVENEIPLQLAAGYVPLPVPDGGRILEVFVKAGGQMRGSMLDNLLDDLGVLLSHLLQLGMTPRGIRNTLGASEFGAAVAGAGLPTTLVGYIADQLVEMQAAIHLELATGQPEPQPQPGEHHGTVSD
jgi:hypothetical protein